MLMGIKQLLSQYPLPTSRVVFTSYYFCYKVCKTNYWCKCLWLTPSPNLVSVFIKPKQCFIIFHFFFLELLQPQMLDGKANSKHFQDSNWFQCNTLLHLTFSFLKVSLCPLFNFVRFVKWVKLVDINSYSILHMQVIGLKCFPLPVLVAYWTISPRIFWVYIVNYSLKYCEDYLVKYFYWHETI